DASGTEIDSRMETGGTELSEIGRALQHRQLQRPPVILRIRRYRQHRTGEPNSERQPYRTASALNPSLHISFSKSPPPKRAFPSNVLSFRLPHTAARHRKAAFAVPLPQRPPKPECRLPRHREPGQPRLRTGMGVGYLPGAATLAAAVLLATGGCAGDRNQYDATDACDGYTGIAGIERVAYFAFVPAEKPF